MSQRVRGKSKIQRIDMLHYRQITWLKGARWTLSSGAALLTGLYVAWVIGMSDPNGNPSALRALQLSTGALSKVHASFENDCQKCHAGDVGIGLSPDSFQLDERSRLELQATKCGECHNQAANFQTLGPFS